MMKLTSQIRLLSCCLFASTSLLAANITGKVTNGTTNKPSAGDEVVLLSLAAGMQETSRTKSDSKGAFSLEVPDQNVQYLIRVAHQRVNYFRPAQKGPTEVEITVYDSATKVDNLTGEGRVFRVLAADGQQIQVSETYILRNESEPPRTWMGDRTFEVVLPEGATLEEGMAAGPGGLPVTSAPRPTGVANHYAFIFPIRPGRSELQVTYKLPYSGSHDFNFDVGLPLAEFGVMLPKGMRFTQSGDSFSPAREESGMTVFVAKSVLPGQQLKFALAGEGAVPRETQGSSTGAGEGSQGGNVAAPGGGLGTPIGAPDPLGDARWFILGLVLVGLAGGLLWMIKRKPVGEAALPASALSHASASGPRGARPEASSRQRPALPGSMLEALKDELFQLETDRLHGRLSQQEYQTAKSSLDVLMRRHLKEMK